jgi:hypothetical protein
MVYPEDGIQTRDKSISEYETLVQEAKKRTRIAAKDYIPKCCDILKGQGLSNERIVHKIRRDFGDSWSQATIYDAIPDEYKKQTKPLKKDSSLESILIEQSAGRGVVYEEPRREPEPDELPTARELEEIHTLNSQPLKTRHEQVFLPIKLADSPAFTKAKTWAKSNGEDRIRFKINNEGDLYLP